VRYWINRVDSIGQRVVTGVRKDRLRKTSCELCRNAVE